MKVTKKARIEEARKLIDSVAMWEEWTPLQLAELSELTGTKITYAMRKPNPSYPSDKRMLEVITGDWIKPAAWSWRRAIESSGDIVAYTKGKQIAALRQGILEQIAAARAGLGDACEKCGAAHDLTVDHAATAFSDIAKDFLAIFPVLQLKDTDGSGGIIADEVILHAWQDYHHKRAAYALLCRSCNSTKGAGVAA
jgi:hypothetical protein